MQAVPINGTVPMTLLTLEATGGVGALRFDLVGDDAKVARVGADGALVVTNFLADETWATITARVRDSAPINNWSEVAVTLAFSFPLSFVSSATEFVVSPDYVGVVHSLAVTGGVGSYVFGKSLRWLGGRTDAVTVDAETGGGVDCRRAAGGGFDGVVFGVG